MGTLSADQLLDFERATELLAQSVTLFRELGDAAMLACMLAELGGVAIQRGDHGAAGAALDEGFAVARQLGTPHELGYVLQNLGLLAMRQGDHPRSRRSLRESLELFTESAELVGVAESLERLGELLLREGAAREAARVLGCAAEVRRRTGSRIYPADLADHDQAVDGIRLALGQPAFEAAWSEGATADPRAIAADLGAGDTSG